MLVAVVSCALVLMAAFGFTRWQTSRIEADYPPDGRFIDLPGGGRLHYTEKRGLGADQGTILLLHGASANQADMMLALGDRLAEHGFTIIAVDRPGLGWSDRPGGREAASPSCQATAIRNALGLIGIDHAIVIGHSLGGAVAARLALDHADFTKALVLLGPVLYPWSTGIAWYYGVAASSVIGPLFTRLLTLPVGLALLPAGIAEVFAPEAPPPDYARRTRLALMLRPRAFAANAQDVARLLDGVRAQAPRMCSIGVPTAIVTGTADAVVDPAIHSIPAARDIAGARLDLLPGIGHSPHWSAPGDVIAAVLDVAARMQPQIKAAGE